VKEGAQKGIGGMPLQNVGGVLKKEDDGGRPRPEGQQQMVSAGGPERHDYRVEGASGVPPQMGGFL